METEEETESRKESSATVSLVEEIVSNVLESEENSNGIVDLLQYSQVG